jgi:hypothetical protein
MFYINYYSCPCGMRWVDKWSCMCNDRCPTCNKEIEPYRSEEFPEDESDLQDGEIGVSSIPLGPGNKF